MDQYEGEFPADFAQLKKLQGIGDYTAAAIASIAFNLPHAVVDGNVFRVISRLFDINTPINSNEGKKTFSLLADELLDRQHPGLHNQAMMEFGALHCTPQNPKCDICPLQAQCLAFANGTVANRPVKENKIKVRERFFNYLAFKINESRDIYIRKRAGKDIWSNLYDFPLIETKEETGIDQLIQSEEFKRYTENNDFTVGKVSGPFIHKLTHQTIKAQFVEIILDKKLATFESNDIFLAHETDLDQYPVPRLIDQYLKLKS